MRILAGVLEWDTGVGPRRTGWWAATAAGLVVSMSVARFFLAMQGTTTPEPGVIAFFGGLFLVALACTLFGAKAALHADGSVGALALTFGANVGPPTVLCAPTVIGLVYSVPAGLIAFTVVAPLVLLTRRSARSERPGHLERERLLGAGWLAATSLALSAVGLLEADGWLGAVPGLVCGLAALAFAGLSAGRDLYRSWLAAAARLGRSGLRLGRDASLERVALTGAGPHRAQLTGERLGALHEAPLRAAAAVLLTAVSAASVVGAAAFVAGLAPL
ncbi:MAG: hypothetical protein SangKO_009300 [Sandaracinaceae bacterium]